MIVPEAAWPLIKVGWIFERQLRTDVRPDDILDVLPAVEDRSVVHNNIERQGYHAVHVKFQTWTH